MGGGRAIGAMLSVLLRITREDFRLNWEASREELWTAGAIRPIVGALLGAAVPMLIIGGIAAVTPSSAPLMTRSLGSQTSASRSGQA